jgi:hypothetical protein
VCIITHLLAGLVAAVGHASERTCQRRGLVVMDSHPSVYSGETSVRERPALSLQVGVGLCVCDVDGGCVCVLEVTGLVRMSDR